PPVPNLAQRLVAIAGETDCERVTREYIMQYLQLNLRETVSASEQRVISNYLKKTAFDVGNKSAGTAMLVLRLDPDVPPGRIEQAAASAFLSTKTDAQNRIVALQLLKEITPSLAANLARDSEANKSPTVAPVMPGITTNAACEGCAR